MSAKESGNLPRIDRFPGHFRGGVVTAGQPDYIEIESLASDFINHATRHLGRKSKIVARSDKTHRAALHISQSGNEGHRTDRQPKLSQLIEGHMTDQTIAHVT